MLDAIKKESVKGDAPNTVREAVCAFANDLPNHDCPGVVFIGVKDTGQAANLEISDDLLRQLSNIKNERLLNHKKPLVCGRFIC